MISKIFIYLILTGGAIAVTGWHYLDKQFSSNWIIFYSWLAVFITSVIYALMQVPPKKYKSIVKTIKGDWKIILFIALLAMITRFALLLSYPYISIGDELRDTGLLGLHISTGLTKDVFDFGFYQGYGNFIPMISFYFLKVLGTSPLVYRIPAAFIGVLTILLTYFIGKKVNGRLTGLVAAVFLTVNFVHMHYSRTELLVVLDGLFSLLLTTVSLSATIFPAGFFLSGLMMGLSYHFYAGIRGTVLVCLSFILLVYGYRLVKQIMGKNTEDFFRTLKIFLAGLVLVSIGFFIGLGPSLNILIRDNLFFRTGNSQPIYSEPSFLALSLPGKADMVYRYYQKAFLVYFSEPTTTHFQFRSSLLTFPVNWLFLAGLFYSLLSLRRSKNILLSFMVYLIFLFPFYSQVILHHAGADHRLMGIIPIAVILASYGLAVLVKNITPMYHKWLIVLALLIFVPYQLYFYFWGRLSDLEFPLREYLFQDIMEYIKKSPKEAQYYIYYNKGGDLNYDPTQFREKIKFDTYPREVFPVSGDEVSANGEIEKDSGKTKYIIIPQMFTGVHSGRTEVISRKCGDESDILIPDFHCPLKYSGVISFSVTKITSEIGN